MPGERHEGEASGHSGARERPVSRGDSLPRHLLEEVLRMTTDALAQDAAPVAAELELLRGVARRHRGRPLSADPVLVEMVAAMLEHEFQSTLSAAEYEPMARCIAESLYEDPEARRRVERLWKQVSDQVG